MRAASSGFTLLEVMVSLAIMAGVILTLLGSVNYHIGIIANERDSTTMTLLARNRMAELEQAPAKGEGTFAPSHPELSWKADLLPADLPGLQKLVVKVRRGSDGKEVALVRYLPK
ncbi:MAG TPA: prepilin-type N-terminal cleavage/methylation domain-containing protein [Desulfuromonadales bacterium]|nr:prepilin-type N-terminal cleavage/methylation domain-containing protein [Desulfuromonadales bacterium]